MYPINKHPATKLTFQMYPLLLQGSTTEDCNSNTGNREVREDVPGTQISPQECSDYDRGGRSCRCLTLCLELQYSENFLARTELGSFSSKTK